MRVPKAVDFTDEKYKDGEFFYLGALLAEKLVEFERLKTKVDDMVDNASV